MGRWLRRPPPLLADTALAAAAAALTWSTILLDSDHEGSLPAWAVLLVLGQTLPLALRRVAPVVVWAVVSVMSAAYGAASLGDPPIFFGAVVAIYTVASRCGGRTSRAVAALSAAMVLAAIIASGDTSLVTAALDYVVLGTAWILGDGVRVRRAYTASLEQRAADLERSREEEVRRAAAGERVRIARELHDVVAHHVSVIALQSQAAEVLIPTEPDRAAEVVGAIGVTARESLAELRRLLSALRQEGDEAPTLSPQPGVDGLTALAESLGRAGLTVELSVEGTARPLPPGVGLSVYRIVQEALTNVVKHARADTASVVLRYEDDAVAVRVADDGIGPVGLGSSGHDGHGLIGMRERVSLYGGDLRVAGGAGRGFTVDARLPVEPSAHSEGRSGPG